MTIQEAMEPYKTYHFSFGGEEKVGCNVSKDTRYCMNQLDYGFITEAVRSEVEELQYPELSSGFEPRYWAQGEELGTLVQGKHGISCQYEGDGFLPLIFAARVSEEGNYRCEICLYSEEDLDSVFLYIGRRNLVYQGKLKGRMKHVFTCVTKLCPIVPRNTSVASRMDTVTVTAIGKGLELVSVNIEKWNCNTIYIAGDSTVTDQPAEYPYSPILSYSGWGQMLSAYVGTDMVVSNHAHSGLTTDSMRSEGHYQTILDRIGPGDICLFQFGHNDQKLDYLKSEEGYRERYLIYLDEIREKGATPIIVSPLARNSWKGIQGWYNDLLEGYARECELIAREEKVPFVDLHKKSMDFICELGREEAKQFFFPSDYTHSNDRGAFLFAGMVYEDLVSQGVLPNNTSHREDALEWNIGSNIASISIPEQFAQKTMQVEPSFLDEIERGGDPLTRVEALELVSKVMKFFPTNVYNDYFDDVLGHETYAGTVEVAYQNGMIPEYMLRDKKLEPNKIITYQEFVDVVRAGYAGRMSGELQFEAEGEPSLDWISREKAAHILRQIAI